MDIAPFEKQWTLNCSHCIKSSLLDWTALQQTVLWYKTAVRGEVIWAWNAQHLELILLKLKQKNIDNHPWRHFATYVKKRWLTKLRKPSDWRKLEVMLER